MTPQEEHLVLELHAKWGNRWSRIARKLPGRTDNEIKNYWRTLMRKKAQEKKRANNISSPSLTRSSSKSVKSSSSSSNITTVDALPFPDSTTGAESFYDTGGRVVSAPKEKKKSAGGDDDDQKVQEKEEEKENGYYSMDDIWKEISLLEVNNDMINMELPFYGSGEAGNDNIKNLMSGPPLTTSSSSVWDDRHIDLDQCYCSDSLWKMDIDEEASYNNYNEFFPTTTTTINDQFFSCFGDGENL